VAGCSPLYHSPPPVKQERGRPLFRNRTEESRMDEQDTRMVMLREPQDRRRKPPRTCQSESAITISDDSDSAAR